MSKFSEKCKELMVENGTNVYRLSNSSSLERTALQRMVTGKRLPNIDFVKQFCREIRMPLQDEESLMELYKMELIGEDVYQSRLCIRRLLHRLSASEPEQYPDFPVVQSIFTNNDTDYTAEASDYNCGTELAIRTVLEKEFSSGKDSSYVYTNFPADNYWFYHQLQILHLRYPQSRISIQHLIHFQMNSTLSSFNLRALSLLLPLALSNDVEYTPWYYYSKIQESDFIELPFPYIVITSAHVLEISGDLQHFILHTDPAKSALYVKEFLRIRDSSRPLLMRCTTAESALEHYVKELPPKEEMIYVLEHYPCFGDLMNQTLYAKLAHRKPEYSHLYPILANHTSSFSGRKIWGVYTHAGLTSLCETRTFTGQVGAFFSPLSPDECLSGLKNFVARDKMHHRHMLSDKISLPADINFEIYANKSLHLVKIDKNLNGSLFVITESSICDAFLDFAQSLADPEFTLSEEESDLLIRNKINELERAL